MKIKVTIDVDLHKQKVILLFFQESFIKYGISCQFTINHYCWFETSVTKRITVVVSNGVFTYTGLARRGLLTPSFHMISSARQAYKILIDLKGNIK